MKKTRQISRLLACVLALAMLLCAFSVAAVADDAPPAPPEGGMGAPPEGGMPPDMPAGEAPADAGAAPADMPPAMPGEAAAPAAAAADLSNVPTSKYFTDLGADTAWANGYIDALYESGVIKGTGEGVFSPNESVIRGDLVLMLYRHYQFVGEAIAFQDANIGTYYGEAIMHAKGSNIVEAAEGNSFKPDEAVTREQAVVWMYKAELYNGMPSDMAGDISSFSDAAQVSEAAVPAFGSLTMMGVVEGNADGTLAPQSTLTRAEMAVLVYKLTNLAGGGGMGGGMGAPPPGGGGGGGLVIGDVVTSLENGKTYTDETFTSTGETQNAARVEDGAVATLINPTVNKTGDATGDGSGDAASFYGCNAGLIALSDGTLNIEGGTVTTDASGANGIFAYGDKGIVNVTGTTVRTSKGGSGGIMVAGGGTLYAKDCDVETLGGSSAAIRSDRGAGIMVVDGGRYVSGGTGSPAIYCTADITVKNATLDSATAEAVVIEGKNSVTLENCDVTGCMSTNNGGSEENIHNIMIYQSMSGDADVGQSSFSMTGGKLLSKFGDFIYVTNTSCKVFMSGVACTLTEGNDCFLRIEGNKSARGWGKQGANGGTCDFTADAQEIKGNIYVDAISDLTAIFNNGTKFEGAFPTADARTCALTLDATSTLSLTGDSYLTAFEGSLDNVTTNGFKLFVGGVQVK